VTKAHVEEAYRLLNKSIIRVDQPDINFEEDEAEAGAVNEADEDEEMMNAADHAMDEDNVPENENASNGDAHSVVESRPDSATQHKKKKIKLSYEEYRKMSNLLLLYMRREEGRSEDEGKETEGLKRSHIVDWYLNEIGDSIDTEDELIEKKEIVEKVIDKLIKEYVIISLVESVMERGQKSAATRADDDDPILVVHPNYVINY